MIKDIVGQEVNIGDWAVITQHNQVYVGKVIRAENSITISENRAREWYQNNRKEFDKINWKDKKAEWEKMFGIDAIKKFGIWNHDPSWVRDGKFVKVQPTKEMELQYENGKQI